MRDFMEPIRKALKGAIKETEEPEKEESPSAGVVARLETMLWPERALEVKRERARARVREEAHVDG